jgi:hypothetical protein
MGGELPGLLGLGWGSPAGWATREWERETTAGPDSVSSRVLAQYRIGIRKILFFFKPFYNLQTNLNSIQILISMTSTHKIKYKNTSPTKEKLCTGMKCNNQIFI